MNRFTTYTAQQLKAEGWLNKQQAEAYYAEIDRLKRLLYKVGICSTCGGELVHDITEPFMNCDGCGYTGEDTVGPPTIQKLRMALDKLARLGNEPYYGNSVGNKIAQDALEG